MSHAEDQGREQGVPRSQRQGHSQDTKVEGKEGEGSQVARVQGEGARWGRRCIVAKITSLISLPFTSEEKVAGSGTSVALPVICLLCDNFPIPLSPLPLFRLLARNYHHHRLTRVTMRTMTNHSGGAKSEKRKVLSLGFLFLRCVVLPTLALVLLSNAARVSSLWHRETHARSHSCARIRMAGGGGRRQ